MPYETVVVTVAAVAVATIFAVTLAYVSIVAGEDKKR